MYLISIRFDSRDEFRTKMKVQGRLMNRNLFRACAISSVTLPLAILLQFGSAGSALADTKQGDWGFPLGQAISVSPATKINWHPEVTCDPLPSVLPTPDTTPCKFDRYTQFVIKAENDSSFINENWSDNSTSTVAPHLALRIKSTKEQVGQCIVEHTTTVRCTPDKSGTVNAGDALIVGDPQDSDPLVAWVTGTSCEDAFWLTIYNHISEPQRIASTIASNGLNDYGAWNDVQHIITNGLCVESE
ncbi:hypothetical protein ACFWIB_42185 [Streptomyces sp. NPDC127051]|uniref:hypothetical protein n=1 Tax=Streptomyces sp. NPDC127051 TaxID=3347119 RepID=UPI00366146D7